MTFSIGDFAFRSDLLLSASAEFRDSLTGDEADQDQSADELLAAARPVDSAILGFVPRPGVTAPPSSVADDLASVLLELQSGNLLVACGLEQRDAKPSETLGMLELARDQIAVARADVSVPAAALGLAPKLNVEFATLESAKDEFRNYSHQFLGEIVDEALATIKSTIDSLKNLGLSNVAEALGDVGKSFPLVADVGRLIRQGMEGIKRALDALVAFIGKDLIDKIRAQLGELWAKIGEGGKAILKPILGVSNVEARIEEILFSATLTVAGVDRATNSLAPLSGNFMRENKLLRLLVNAVGLAAKLVALFHPVAGPLVLAVSAAYFTAIGAVLAIGGEYTGGRRLLGRIDGVEQVAEHLQVLQA